MPRGHFITFEGGDGTGKSTQARLLAQRLAATGHAVLATREPGGTPIGEAIRRILLEHAPTRTTELMMFAAARAEHVERLIRPALEGDGATVICDRFTDSTRVYQGLIAGAPAHLIATLEGIAAGGLQPDLTIILDLPPQIGRDRALTRGAGNRFDRADVGFHERVRQGFLEIAAAEPSRCVVLDASPTAADLANQVLDVAVRRLGLPVGA